MFMFHQAQSKACVFVAACRGFGLALTLALAACSSNSTALLPPAPQNMQTGQLAAKPTSASAIEQAQIKAALKNCPTSAEPAKTIGVSAMLEQARKTSKSTDTSNAPQMSKAESDCLAARVKAQLLETSNLPPTSPAVAASIPQKAGGLTIDFDGETAPISPKDKSAIAALVAAKKAGSANKVRIFAGRGGAGNMFDQAVVAHNRANRVKELLPPGMVVSVEFDPQQIDDTVRIEFVDQS
jgi:hypothetical protein